MRVHERLRVFYEWPWALTGLGGLCRQMSRYVCKCRAFLGFFAAVVGIFLHLLARFGVQFWVFGRFSVNFLGEV